MNMFDVAKRTDCACDRYLVGETEKIFIVLYPL